MTNVREGVALLAICLSFCLYAFYIFSMITQKGLKLRSPNLMQAFCSGIDLRFKRSKVSASGLEIGWATKGNKIPRRI